MGYLLDTNIVSAFINNVGGIRNKLNTVIREGENISLSVITHYEIRGLLAVNATRKMKIFDEICNQFGILWIDRLDLSEKAAGIHAELRKKGKPISDNDIMIAATALIHNLTLVTDNGHFDRIRDVRVENWLRELI